MTYPRTGFARVALAGVLALASVVLPGCSSLTEEAPPVQDSLLVAALVDLHLAEARGALDVSPPPEREALLARHGLDAARFRAAMDYYAERPEAFHVLYGRVLDRLHADARLAPSAPPDP